MGMAMIAEASLEPEPLAAHTRRTIVESARLVVPAVAVIVVFASLLLSLMGASYSDEASTLLRLLALSAIPFIFVAAYANAARVEQRMRAVVWTYASLCAIVFALGIPLLESIGIVGLGIAWLVAQCVVAVGVIIASVRREPSDATFARSFSGRSPPCSSRHAHGACASARPEAREGILARLRRDHPGMSSWGVHGHLGASNDVAVASLGPAGGEPVLLLKRSCSRHADRSLADQERVLSSLESDREPRSLAKPHSAGDRQRLSRRPAVPRRDASRRDLG